MVWCKILVRGMGAFRPPGEHFFEKANVLSICQIQHFVIFGTIYEVIIQEVHDIKYTLGLYLSG